MFGSMRFAFRYLQAIRANCGLRVQAVADSFGILRRGREKLSSKEQGVRLFPSLCSLVVCLAIDKPISSLHPAHCDCLWRIFGGCFAVSMGTPGELWPAKRFWPRQIFCPIARFAWRGERVAVASCQIG